VVRRTWAPKGHTPVLRHKFNWKVNWKRASLAGICCYHPDGSDARLLLHVRPGAYDTDALITVLTQFHQHVHQHIGDDKLTLLWDGLPAHRSHKMHAFLRAQRRWLVVEPLPAYAPELNPVEGLWSNLKGVELANLTGDTLAEVLHAAERGTRRVQHQDELLFSFLQHTKLTL
jgi:transposase